MFARFLRWKQTEVSTIQVSGWVKVEPASFKVAS
jgi:hypothetical protein